MLDHRWQQTLQINKQSLRFNQINGGRILQWSVAINWVPEWCCTKVCTQVLTKREAYSRKVSNALAQFNVVECFAHVMAISEIRKGCKMSFWYFICHNENILQNITLRNTIPGDVNLRDPLQPNSNVNLRDPLHPNSKP